MIKVKFLLTIYTCTQFWEVVSMEKLSDILLGSKANFAPLCLISCWDQRQMNRRFPSCISPLFQSESKCEAFHMEISFIHMQTLVHLHANKTNFQLGFALGLALKLRQKATRKSPIAPSGVICTNQVTSKFTCSLS